MEKKQLYKIGIVAGAALAVVHYFMTAITSILGSASLYELLAEEDGYLFMYFWPQVVLTGFVLIAVLSYSQGNSIFIITIMASVAYAIELLFIGGEGVEDLGSIPAPIFLGAIGVLIMCISAFSLNKIEEDSAPKKVAESFNKETINIPIDDPVKGEKTVEVPVNEADRSDAYIEFISGELQGAKLEMTDDIIIGKNAEMCNIILSNPKCSRVHCTIKFDKEKAVFVVRDLSTNGLFIANAGRLTKDTDYEIHRGTILSIADTEDRFKLY